MKLGETQGGWVGRFIADIGENYGGIKKEYNYILI